MRLLLVEDDSDLGARLKTTLGHAGFAVDWCQDGIEAQYLGESEAYDVVVLDLGLPARSGLDVLRNWRAAGLPLPVLILTARDQWFERVDGFKAGADDYLGKPFHHEELLARLNALIRRANPTVQPRLSVGGWSLDEDTQSLRRLDGDDEMPLTGTEFRLLRYFLLHPGKIISKSEINEHVYAYDSDKDSNVIEVYINRLRQKLGKEVIETRRGQGYVYPRPEP
ncbi:MAG: response regulator transcription factor [Thiotrichales bacterium]